MKRIHVLLVSLLLILAATLVHGQEGYDDYYSTKPGSCPPALPVQICSQACIVDAHCQGIGKCCPTSCGGTVCSRPVTMRNTNSIEKAGSCPAVPTGRWVCSPTCSVDGDCRGPKKCCKNRCGALTCQSPEIQVVPEAPIAPPEIMWYDNRDRYYV